MAYIIGEGDFSGYVVKVGAFVGKKFVTQLNGETILETDVWEITSETIPYFPLGIADRYLLPIRPGDLQEAEKDTDVLQRP